MHARSIVLGLALLAAAGACRRGGGGATPAPAPDAISSAADVLERAASAHPAAPATASFTQASTVTLSSGNITQRQRVIVQAPGRMRVDNLPLSGRTGAIYLSQRAITFARGRRVAASNERNPLLLLGFGIYRLPAAEAQAALQAMGIAGAVVHEGTFDGSPVWIIGASPGDTTTNQLWVHATAWVPVRLIQSERRGARRVTSDTRYRGHAAPQPTIPRTIEIFRAGRRALRAEISDVRVGIAIPPQTFDTTALRPIEP